MDFENPMSLQELMEVAVKIRKNLVAAGWTGDLTIQQALNLVEETGEFVGALRRFKGMARRSGTFAEMAEELADVVITAFVAAVVFDVNLPSEINGKLTKLFNRGWREQGDHHGNQG
jgi:NTP pyrophosphatase (non-canonical NTP hydrolase)